MKFLKRDIPSGPSPEAIQAREEARELREKADVIYHERRHLTRTNHWADRIRLIYEGR